MGLLIVLRQLWSVRIILIMVLTPLFLLPLPLYIGTGEAKAAFVLILMAVLWITEAIPIAVTAMFPIFLFPMLGVVKAKEIAPAYMSDTLMVFIGGLIMATAIEIWDIHKLLALRILLNVGSKPRWLILGLMLPTWFLSMWISNTATTAMMIPIAQAILTQLKVTNIILKEDIRDIDRVSDEEINFITSKSEENREATEYDDIKYKKLCKAISLCICYAANCGGIGALTGTGPNLVVKGFADELYAAHGMKNPVTYATWMGYGLPLSFLVLIVTWNWLQFFFLGFSATFDCKDKKQSGETKVQEMIRKQYDALGPVTYAQKNVLVLFSILVVCWITRDIGGVGGWGDLFTPLYVRDSTPAILVAVLLFFLPSELPPIFCNRDKEKNDRNFRTPRPLLTWQNVHEKLPWGLFILLGGGFALAKGCHVSGLSSWIGLQLEVFIGLNKWLMLLILCYICEMLTEFISNVALATLIVPILAELAMSTGVNPLFYILPAAVSASFAYMLPVATAPNALCFSYGHIRVLDMVTAGFFMNLIAIPMLVFATCTWGDAIFHFQNVPFTNSSWERTHFFFTNSEATDSIGQYFSVVMLILGISICCWILLADGFIISETGHENYNVTKSSSIEGHYKHAAVATDTEICSQVGVDIMKIKGGSTVDAAIATLLCVGLANSMSTGIGGGHFMTIYKRSSKKVFTINAREMAPAAASQEMFKSKSSEKGGLAIAVPGQLMGMWQAYKLGGKLPWKDLFKPAISLCKNGIPVSSTLVSSMHSELRKNPPANLRKLFTNPDTKTYYKAGEKMKRPELAQTLEAVANEGVNAFYNGSLTDVISKEIQDAGGIITSDDLKNYVATVDDPVSIKLYNGITLYSPPPPSTGAVFQYVLNILNGYKMDPTDFETKTQTLTEHRIIEAFKFAFAKRSTLGDPEVGTAEFKHNISQIVSDLTNLNYGETTRSEINDHRTFNYKHYHPAFSLTETHGTTHLSLLGPTGDAVAITSTVNLYFGSDVVGANTGIIYNDEMDDFSTPNTTNYFGVPASPANFIKPMKRPLSSMTPSIAVAATGDVVMVVGASGGTKITTAVARVVMESLWFKWGIKKSIDYPRLHDQLVPEVCEAERGYPSVVFDELKGIGHNMTWVGGGSVVQGILQLKPGDITANSDYRKGGKPAGY